MDYARRTDLIIETKKSTFSTIIQICKTLKAYEEMSIFPPGFKFKVKSTGHSCTQLQTKFNVRLYKEKTHKPDKDIILNLLVLAPATMKGDSIAHSNGEHDCDCLINKVELTHFMQKNCQ